MLRIDMDKARSYLYQTNQSHEAQDELDEILSQYGHHPKTPIKHKISPVLKLLIQKAYIYYKNKNQTLKTKKK
jgi:hypothetical protein